MNTNEVNHESKTALIKTLAIIGFIAVIVFGVWLSVQIVRVIPGAFSSLASIADGIYNNRPVDTLSISTEKDIVNSGESFQVTWTDTERNGTYGFTYLCTNGVSVDVRSGGNVATLTCGETLELAGNVTSVDVIASSEKQRFIDLPFTIIFTGVGQDEPLFEKNGRITIVNASIPQSVGIAETDDEDTEETADDSDTSATGQVAAVAQPIVTEQVITRMPVSDPNGFVDLKMTYLGVGEITGNSFTPSATIDNDERGALRFEVRNIGTKTSDDWTFEVLLPTGMTFESDEQTPLKPNERATITVGFDTFNETGTQDIEGSVDVDDDTNNSNDSFEWSVRVTE
jgi:hypothetical protein